MFSRGRRRHSFRHGHGHRGIERNVLRLSNLEPGQRAQIIRVGGRGRSRRRFMEMGLVSGETILVERVAPLGDPVEFFVKGYHVSLRRSDAQHIEVRILAEPSVRDA
jgi:ferrous iron transport protein A